MGGAATGAAAGGGAAAGAAAATGPASAIAEQLPAKSDAVRAIASDEVESLAGPSANISAGSGSRQKPKPRGELTSLFNLLTGIPAKRVGGCALTWVGVMPVAALGVQVIPRHKLAQASAFLSEIVAGKELPFDYYRSQVSFLIHLAEHDPEGRASMYGFFYVCSAALQFGPSYIVRPTPLMQEQAQSKLLRLQRSAGLPFHGRPTQKVEPWSTSMA